MKKFQMLFAALVLGCASLLHAGPYGEIISGMIGSKGSQAPIYGYRLGNAGQSLDLSVGYWAARGMNSTQLLSGGLDLHVVGFELYRKFPVSDRVTGKLGGGAGFTIPNLDSGANEQADNGHSWIFGGGVDYALTSAVSIGASVKAFFFSTDTHITTYSSHPETLNTGQEVEVLDVEHHDDMVNFNSVILGVALRWK